MEHLPDRDPPPLHAGYWGDQGMIQQTGNATAEGYRKVLLTFPTLNVNVFLASPGDNDRVCGPEECHQLPRG